MKASPPPADVHHEINSHLNEAKSLRFVDPESSWAHLEDAHVLSQPWIRPHVKTHISMLALGWSQQNRPEVVGQLFRLAMAGPASALGRYPVGNTGRATVSAFASMPIDKDLHDFLKGSQQEPQERLQPSNSSPESGRLATYKITGWFGGLALKAYAKRRRPKSDPSALQDRQLLSLVQKAKETKFGQDHNFGQIRSVQDYQRQVPIRTFDDFWTEYWSEPFPTLQDVTWPGTIPYFARSSGTTTGNSKHIPCSMEMVKANQRGGVEVLLEHLRNRPNSQVSAGRTFLFGGSPELDELAPGIFAGELTGITARETISWAGKDRYYPPPNLAAIADWGDKVEKISTDLVGKNIRSISGVPTWLQVLFDRAFENAGIEDRRLDSLFPDLELITHGGVNFAPYESTFKELLKGSRAELREVYAASEGFIAVADRDPGEGMRLLLDNGLFYEFIDAEQLDETNPKRHWIDDVRQDTNYAIIVTSSAGLWSYQLGDLVRFVDLETPRILVAGRISHTMSTFGEHVTGEELEIAVAAAAHKAGISMNDFAVTSVPDKSGAVGHHRYVIESTGQTNRDLAAEIDDALAQQNADYRTKREDNIVISAPKVETVPPGTFNAWMTSKGRAGGQRKVPRVTSPEQLDQIVQSAQRSPSKKANE